MTLSQFKIFLESKKRGDIKLPGTNELYQPLIQESLEYVAKQCKPIDLRTNDFSKETLRFISANLQIRKPIATIENDEDIDIDEQLVYAVAYDFLANKSTDALQISRYETKRDEEISAYEWNNYALLNELKE